MEFLEFLIETGLVSRIFYCTRCGNRRATDAKRGPLPKVCEPCKLVIAEPPPPERVIVRDPFNSTPTTAPITVGSQVIPSVAFPADFVPPGTSPVPVSASAVTEPPGPGPLELQLTAELGAMQMINPTAKTQSLLALQLARAADRLDPGDVKTMLTVGKELRALLDGLNKAPRAGGDDDDESKPFGAVRPEIQHPPAV